MHNNNSIGETFLLGNNYHNNFNRDNNINNNNNKEVEIKIQIERSNQNNTSNHMNFNDKSNGFRGSLKRLFSDKSTSSSSIKCIGKENNNNNQQFSKKANSAANTPVLKHKTRGSVQNNHYESGSITDLNEYRSRRTSTPPTTNTNNASSKNSPKPKPRSQSRGTSFIKRLSFKFKSQASSNSLDDNNNNNNNERQPSTIYYTPSVGQSLPREILFTNSNNNGNNYHRDIGLPPQPVVQQQQQQAAPKYKATKTLYYNSITQTYVDNPTSKNYQHQQFNNFDDSFVSSSNQHYSQQQSQEDEVQLNLETMQKVFNIFDSDLDGSITIEDVQNVMNSLQFLQNEIELPSLDQIKIAFEKFDENKNGSIEFDEFLNILKSSAAQTTLSNNSNIVISSSATSSPQPQHRQHIASSNMAAFNAASDNNKSYYQQPSYENNQYATRVSVSSASASPHPPRQQQQPNYSIQNGFETASQINASEFNQTAKENMRLIFEQFDKDNDGKITKNELNFVMCNLFPDEEITENDINEMLDAADLDRNGFIDFNEFANMFKLYDSNVTNEIKRIESQSILNSSQSNLVQNKLTDLKLNESSSRRYSRSNLKKNESNKSTKSLAKSLSRSNSKDGAGARSRTASQSAANQSTVQSVQASPSNYRRFFQLFTASHLMDLKAAFTMFDKNGDQKISESELLQVMKYLGLNATEKEVRAMIQVVDKNRNGFVDYDEFIQMMTNTPLKPFNAEEELLHKTFQIFDIDGNGYISADEIKQTMANLGENLTDAEVNDMIKAADKNGDGKIDLNEFSGLINGVGVPLTNK